MSAIWRPDTRNPKAVVSCLPPVDDDRLLRVIDALEEVAADARNTVPQIAINWLLRRPTVSSVIIGERNEEQLRQNLGAVGWTLSPEHRAALDTAGNVTPPYPHTPYRQQKGFARLSPSLVRAAPAPRR